MTLDRDRRLHAPLPPALREAVLPPIDPGLALRDLAARLRRHPALLLLPPLLAGLAAMLWLLLATPLYTARGALLVDPRIGQGGEAAARLPGLILSDGLTVDSELRVLRSREVTGAAARGLGIAAEAGGPSLLARLQAWAGLAPETPALPPEARAARRDEAARQRFLRGLEAARAGDSFVIELAYTDPDLGLAARAVNALMQAYLRHSTAQADAANARRAGWLSARIAGLEAEIAEADSAIAAYRRRHALLVPEGGLLPSGIALNAAHEELVRLRGAAMAADLRARALADQLDAGEIGAVRIAPGEATRALEEYEARHARLLQEERRLALNWPPEAPLRREARARREEARGLVAEEYRRIAARQAAQARALERRAAAVETLAGDLRARYAEDAAHGVTLAALEREAEAARGLRARLVAERDALAQRATREAAPARVIAWAVPPESRAAPDAARVLGLSALAGLLLGLGGALMREALDDRLRRPAQAREIGLDWLGLVPHLGSEARAQRRRGARPEAPPLRARGPLRAARDWGFAARYPRSRAAETMRAIALQLAPLRAAIPGGVVIGFAPCAPGAGATTTAANFAMALARRGESVVLLDLDRLSGGLGRALAPVLPAANRGGALLRAPETALADLRELPGFAGLALIADPPGPSGPSGPTAPAPPRGDPAPLIAALRARFDHVVIDLAPAETAETRARARACDALVLVARWGGTPLARIAAARAGLGGARLLGLVAARARPRRYRLYQGGDA